MIIPALAASLMKIDVEGVNVRIIHTAVGAINESDVTLANASLMMQLKLQQNLEHHL
jgi:translation initiation factor IF-2